MREDYDPKRLYKVNKNEYRYKPDGLWLSTIGTTTNWRTWTYGPENDCDIDCPDVPLTAQEQKEIDDKFKTFNVKLDTILVIDSLAKIKQFTKDYASNTHWYTASINWEKIAKLYDGILIYNFNRCEIFKPENKELHWYAGWDVDSCCVWNLSCVELE